MTRALVDASSLAGYMEIVLPVIGAAFGAEKVALIDYREQTDDFVLLHFFGYASDGRYALQRRMPEMQLGKAVETRRPFRSERNAAFLCLPFYFRDILEAVIVLEGAAPELTPELQEAALAISRFQGLLMSSSRLKVNQEQVVDMNDLQMARKIQLSYLPGDHPCTERYEIFGYNKSSALVGGDYFDYFRFRDGSIQCVLADACGHGMAAALIVTTFRGLLHAQISQLQDFGGLFDSLNRSVHTESEYIQYLTGIFLDYDEKSRTLRYLNAGHFDPLVITPSGEAKQLPGGGPPLGMFRGSSYPFQRALLAPGDVVALFTDGLADIRNAHDEYFGVNNITAALREYREKPLDQIAKTVLDRASNFSDERIEDDVTLFLMRVR